MSEHTTIAPDLPTKAKPNRLRRGGLFIKDEELMERLGIPEKVFWEAIHALDANHKNTGFPQKEAFWGGRRYLPAVLDYLDHHYGFKMPASTTARRRHVNVA